MSVVFQRTLFLCTPDPYEERHPQCRRTSLSSTGSYADALRLFGRHHLSRHDSLIVAAAAQAECGVLYSEDLQHGRRFDGLQIENPFL